ncbi:hypothetical protein BJ170DRAFT_710321 [Xylariales sp. AK1849]|nr:hypothetical protein BJ170DRAFT_710321 [Xylariales sp. AK1849]
MAEIPPFPDGWQPDVAPGVSPKESLQFLRPVGPPPTGQVRTPQQPWRLDPPYSPPPIATLEWAFCSPPVAHSYYQDPQHGGERHVIQEPSQFRDIAPYFDSGRDENDNEVVIDMSCPVCGRLLEVPNCVAPLNYPNPDIEPLVVTPCSHMLGAHCLEINNRYRDEGGEGERACPICRFPLVYSECKCRIPLRPYNPRFPRRQQLPLTIPEGGRVHDICRECAFGNAEFNIDGVLEHSFPLVSESEYADPAVVGPYHVLAMIDWLRNSLVNAVRWQDNSVMRW